MGFTLQCLALQWLCAVVSSRCNGVALKWRCAGVAALQSTCAEVAALVCPGTLFYTFLPQYDIPRIPAKLGCSKSIRAQCSKNSPSNARSNAYLFSPEYAVLVL